MGNIAPYSRKLLRRISEYWMPSWKSDSIEVSMSVDRSGKLLMAGILRSSGNRQLDEKALQAIMRATFPPLPNEFKGDQLQVTIQMAQIEALWQ